MLKRIVLGILFLLTLAGVFTAAFSVQLAKATSIDWWPMFRHDLTHSGYSTSTPSNTNHILWSYKTGDSVVSSPAVSGGILYVGSDDGNVYALGCSSSIPEFPSYLVLPLFMVATLVVVFLSKRKQDIKCY